MKIYIHTDLEGVSGVSQGDMIKKENDKYIYSLTRLMMDVNAAIEGAFEAGATEVTVLDSHAGGGNFILPMLDKRAVLDTKDTKWGDSFDSTYAATFFIGAHAMAGTMNAFLDHTRSSIRWYNYIVNDRRTGELGQWAMLAAHYDVPLIMVSGDEAACTEAHDFFPDVVTVAVKKGLLRDKALIIDPKLAVSRIKEGARNAMSLIGKAKPYKPEIPRCCCR